MMKVKRCCSFAREPASRAESNRSVVSLNRLVSVLLACSAGSLTLNGLNVLNYLNGLNYLG